MSRRARWTRAFLWVSILSTAIGLGAKIFDLIVVAGAWGASPPESLKLMPYGPRYPMNPGDFFQPLSVPMLVGILGALIAGWKAPFWYRKWLGIPMLMFILIWIFTPTVFWPMIRELYGAGIGRIVLSPAEAAHVVRKWIICDWLRVVAIALAFVSSVRAISVPFPEPQDSPAAEAAK